MTWAVSLTTPTAKKIAARFDEIQRDLNDAIDTRVVAERIGIAAPAFRIYARALGMVTRSPRTVIYAKRFPALVPLLKEQGEAEFLFECRRRHAEEKQAMKAAVRQRRQETQEHGLSAVAEAVKAISEGVDRNEAIRQARRSGATLVDIGHAFGVTRERVRQLCNGEQKFNEKRRWVKSRFDHDKILTAVEAGCRQREIAQAFGCSIVLVNRIAQRVDKERIKANRMAFLEELAGLSSEPIPVLVPPASEPAEASVTAGEYIASSSAA